MQTNNDIKLIHCLEKLKSVAMVPGIEAFRLPAIADVRISYVPYNYSKMTAEDWQDLQIEFNIGSWLDPSEDGLSPIPLAARLVLNEVKCY